MRLIGFDWSKKAHKFVRGLDFIKRGVAPIARVIGEELICKFLDIMETRSVREVVEEGIKSFGARKWEFDGFIKSAEYKPDKKNIAVINAVQRWEKENKPVPAPGERFNYVYVHRSDNLSMFGRKIKMSAADRMEMPDVAKANGLEIDLEAYMTGTIKGLLARFISYDKEFRGDLKGPLEADDEEDAEDDEDDMRATNAAKKVIGILISNSMKGADELTPKEIKSAALEKLELIKAQLPATCLAAFDAYKKFLIKLDGQRAKGEKPPMFVNFINDLATADANKLKIVSIIAKLTQNIQRAYVYELFVGKKFGRSLVHVYREVINKEHNEVLIDMVGMEINDVDNIVVFCLAYNKLVLLKYQLNFVVAVSREAFGCRK